MIPRIDTTVNIDEALGRLQRAIDDLDRLIASHCAQADYLERGSISESLLLIHSDLTEIIECLV